MTFILGILITLAALLLFRRVRLPGRVDAAKLGWMSERWLAGHRASHGS